MNLRSLRRPAVLLAAALVLGSAPVCGQSADAPAAMPATTTPTVFDNPALVQQYQATITPEDLAAHLYVLASDYFEGRETATRGQKLAALYLAGQYRKMGLTPGGTAAAADSYAPAAYFQPFDLYGRRLARATLAVQAGGQTVATSTFGPDEFDGQAYLALGSLEQSQGGVVFAGYGIADDALGYNDLAALAAKGIDLSGQWMLILRDEPLSSDSTSLLPTEDGKPSRWTSQLFAKVRAAYSGGAPAGVLIVGDVGPGGTNVAQRAALMARTVRESLGNLSMEEPGAGRAFPPIYVVSSALADKILAPTGRTVAQVKQQIDGTLRPDVFAVPGVRVESAVAQETFTVQSENVVAFVEGTDPTLKHEVVVLSSHYDHVGIDAALEGDQIHNGADDDGSGTVATLEMAEAFVQAKADGYGPRRSILFLNVAGEEKGLLGSRYFTDVEPVVPLDEIVTNLNIDMIGRHDPTHPGDDPNYVYIIGSRLISQELHDLNARANEITGTDLDLNERFNSKDDPNQFYRRSDHWNFGKHAIPFIFFFTGTHEDYHGVDDEPEKIDYDRMARITRLIFATAWQVANQEARPAVSGQGFN